MDGKRVELGRATWELLDILNGGGYKDAVFMALKKATEQFKQQPNVSYFTQLYLALSELRVQLEINYGSRHGDQQYLDFLNKVRFLYEIIAAHLTALHKQAVEAAPSTFACAVPSAPPLNSVVLASAVSQERRNKLDSLLRQQAASIKQHGNPSLKKAIHSQEMIEFLVNRAGEQQESLLAIRLKSSIAPYDDHEFGIGDNKANPNQFLKKGIATFSKIIPSPDSDVLFASLGVQQNDDSAISLQEFLIQFSKDSFFNRKLIGLDQCPKKWINMQFLVSDSQVEEEQGCAKCKLLVSPLPSDSNDTVICGRTLQFNHTFNVWQPLTVGSQQDKIWHKPKKKAIFASGNVFEVTHVDEESYVAIKEANDAHLKQLQSDIDHKFYLQIVIKAQPVLPYGPRVISRGCSPTFYQAYQEDCLKTESFYCRTLTTAKQSDDRRPASKGSLEQGPYQVSAIEVSCIQFTLLSNERCRCFSDFYEGERSIISFMDKQHEKMESAFENMKGSEQKIKNSLASEGSSSRAYRF